MDDGFSEYEDRHTKHISQDRKIVTEAELVKIAKEPIEKKTKPKVYVNCKYCKKEILQTKTTRYYCGNACRVKAAMSKSGKKVMLLSSKEQEIIIEFRKQNPELDKKPKRIRKYEQLPNSDGIPARKISKEEKKEIEISRKERLEKETKKELGRVNDLVEIEI